MNQIRLYLLLSFSLFLAGSARSADISNDDQNIVLTSTCLFMPAGTFTYTLTLAYADPDNGFTSTSPISVSVVSSGGGSMTITRATGNFPAPDNNGYWALRDADNGSISLTGGPYSGIMFWYHNPDGSLQVDCVPLPVWFSSFTATGGSFQAALNWTTDLEQNSTYIEIYRASTNTPSAFYKIGQVTAAGNSSIQQHYSFTDLHPCTSNYYYLKMLNSQGTPAIYSNTISFGCSGCSCTIPSPVNCNFTINGPDHICNIQTPTAYQLSSAVPNYSTISWSVDVPAAVKLTTYPNFDRTQVTLLKKDSAVLVALKATLSGCTNVITKYVVMGVPAPYMSCTEVCPDVYVYADNRPGATSYDWHFTDETIGYSWVLTNYVPGWNGTLTVGDVYDIGFVYNNACGTSASADLYGISCDPGEGFMIAPNPSKGAVTIDMSPFTAKAATASKNLAKTPKTPVTPVTPAKVYQIRVVDVKGAVQKTFNYPGGTERISLDLSGLNNGVYIIQVFNNRTWRSGKLVLAK